MKNIMYLTISEERKRVFFHYSLTLYQRLRKTHWTSSINKFENLGQKGHGLKVGGLKGLLKIRNNFPMETLFSHPPMY